MASNDATITSYQSWVIRRPMTSIPTIAPTITKVNRPLWLTSRRQERRVLVSSSMPLLHHATSDLPSSFVVSSLRVTQAAESHELLPVDSSHATSATTRGSHPVHPARGDNALIT